MKYIINNITYETKTDFCRCGTKWVACKMCGKPVCQKCSFGALQGMCRFCNMEARRKLPCV